MKETGEKWQTALREIEVLQQTGLEDTNSQIDELQNLFHKISVYEKQIADQCHLLEANDRTIKTLQSDLSENEQKLVILEAQKNELSMQTVNNKVTDAVADDVSNTVEMEMTISSLKEQIAGIMIILNHYHSKMLSLLSLVLEASNIAYEDALATQMTKFAEYLEEARTAHIESERYKEESLSIVNDNELIQLRLTEAQNELAALQEEYSQLRNVTHRNTLQQLASAEGIVINYLYSSLSSLLI